MLDPIPMSTEPDGDLFVVLVEQPRLPHGLTILFKLAPSPGERYEVFRYEIQVDLSSPADAMIDFRIRRVGGTSVVAHLVARGGSVTWRSNISGHDVIVVRSGESLTVEINSLGADGAVVNGRIIFQRYRDQVN
jgi:hypothetical protein